MIDYHHAIELYDMNSSMVDCGFHSMINHDCIVGAILAQGPDSTNCPPSTALGMWCNWGYCGAIMLFKFSIEMPLPMVPVANRCKVGHGDATGHNRREKCHPSEKKVGGWVV